MQTHNTVSNRINRRLKVLALGPQEAWPPTDGGREGIYGALVSLAAGVELLYACPATGPKDSAVEHFRSIGIDFHPISFTPTESVSTVLFATLQAKPFKFHKYCTVRALEAVVDSIGHFRPDLILCFHAHTAELGERVRRSLNLDVPIVVREHNIEYEMVASYGASLSSLKRIIATSYHWLTRRYEQSIWRHADAVAFLTDHDLATAQSSCVRGNFILAPEGVPIPPERPLRYPSGAAQLLLPLNPRAPQSVANLKLFVKDYWTRVSSHPSLAGVTLAITGVNPLQLEVLTGLGPDRQEGMRMRALGFLPSLTLAFESSLAVLAPTFVGSGIRKKVLEGMANQVPVIATELDVKTCSYFDPPNNILLLGDPESFVETVGRLLHDQSHWLNIAVAGRHTIERHATWERFAKILLEEIDSLVARRRKEGA